MPSGASANCALDLDALAEKRLGSKCPVDQWQGCTAQPEQLLRLCDSLEDMLDLRGSDRPVKLYSYRTGILPLQ
jgi:hypothetical protein